MCTKFAASDVQILKKDPASSLLSLSLSLSFLLSFSLWRWHFDSEPELGINQERQVLESKCLERLRFYDEVNEQSLTEKLQFPHLPVEKACEFKSPIQSQDKILSKNESVAANGFLFFSLLERISLVRGVLLSLIIWKLQLFNCRSIQTLVVVTRRSRDKYKRL